MILRTALSLGLLCSLMGGAAYAQSNPGAPAVTSDTRNPMLGDPGVKPAPRTKPKAAALARADKQPPGTENGNQPDRASAGGGGR